MATDHILHLIHQAESRPGPDGWVERRRTGLGLALCNCGYTSGWVPKDQVCPGELLGKHGMPLTNDGQGTDLH